MHNILLQILQKKKEDLIEQKKKNNFFKQSILSAQDIAIIAEIKLASPTQPSLGLESEIIEQAKAYETSGADAISFITEEHYFKGNITYISQLKRKINLPVLQKDFIIDTYQIYQAKLAGADALLLIARYLELKDLKTFVTLCLELGIEPVVEIHSEEDIKKAIHTKTTFIAVNARNLEDFTIHVNNACALLNKIPNTFIKLGFSGIHSFEEVNKYKNAGARGVLIGTELMKTKNIQYFISSLRKFD